MLLVVVMKQNVSQMGLCFNMVSRDIKTDITLWGFILANTNTFNSTIIIIENKVEICSQPLILF